MIIIVSVSRDTASEETTAISAPAAEDVRFAFGANWQDFAAGIDTGRLEEAIHSLQTLLRREDLAGLSFLDIGSGSGLFSVAACSLGARVHSFDYDANAVDCTKALQRRFAGEGAAWTIEQGSILDAAYVGTLGQFDVVYSWGVLHHTGDMWRALENAASLVAPGGTLAIALYQRTPLCGAWTVEKRLYSAAPAWIQAAIRGGYKIALLARVAAGGRNPISYARDHRSGRGMTWRNDVHDWLGGYPYQSAHAREVLERLEEMEFVGIRTPAAPAGIGLFGAGCAEYVATRA